MRQLEQAKPSRPTATWVAHRLQTLYEHNRVPETWGSPSVSRPTFETLRAEGFGAAGRYLLYRLRETGQPHLSPVEKLTAVIAGVTIVTLANSGLRSEKRPEMMVGAVRRFSSTAPTMAVVLYTLGAALLVAGSGGGSSGGGGWSYPGSDTSTDYQAYGRLDEEDGKRSRWSTDAWDEMDEEDNPPPCQN